MSFSVTPDPAFLSPQFRSFILKRDNYRCQLCGRGIRQDAQVVVGFRRDPSNGGTNHEDNVLTLCDWCHEGKGTDDL